MRPFFSIIIPYHNSALTIGPLLQSIANSKNAPALEVIVVDDGSETEFRETSDEVRGRDLHTLSIRTIRFEKNMGPAVARNKGASRAKGKFLVFLDSDVILFPDALANLTNIFTEDPDVVAVTGVWAKHQKSTAFFPNFKALRDWSYWINERDKSGYYFLFSTRIASIKREVFERLHGFDEVYAGPLVEDIEFTYRIARRYAIIFAPNVRVHHEFEGFLPIAKKYFWRTYYWTKLYEHRKKFDPVATTSQEAVTALSGVGTLGFFMGSILLLLVNSRIFNFPFGLPVGGPQGWQFSIFHQLLNIFYVLTLFFLSLHIFLIRKFLVFVFEEKGIIFAVKSFFVGLALYACITAGAIWSKISK